MTFFESVDAFFHYGTWTLFLFACAYVLTTLATESFDCAEWVGPVALVGLLAIWLLIPHGWNLLAYKFSGNWNYGDDIRVSSIGPDDAWFILKVEFWAAVAGTVLGYLGLGKLRHEW